MALRDYRLPLRTLQDPYRHPTPHRPDTRKRRPVTRHNPPLLFDLSNDLGETKNIAASHPEVVTRLLAEKKAFGKSAPPGITAIRPPDGWQWDRPVPAHTRKIENGLALTIDAGRVWAGENSRNRLLSTSPAAPASIAAADVELVNPLLVADASSRLP